MNSCIHEFNEFNYEFNYALMVHAFYFLDYCMDKIQNLKHEQPKHNVSQPLFLLYFSRFFIILIRCIIICICFPLSILQDLS